MGFASAGAADEDRVTPGVEEAARGEFTHQPFIDRRVREDELVDILENRELGSADTIADRAGLPVGAFGPDQACDERIEMGLPDTACSVYRASLRPYRGLFESAWGAQAFAIAWPANVEQVCNTPGPP